jgi:hypothetical protein
VEALTPKECRIAKRESSLTVVVNFCDSIKQLPQKQQSSNHQFNSCALLAQEFLTELWTR